MLKTRIITGAGFWRHCAVPGDEHGMSYLVNKDGYETAVKQFWNDYDGE